MKMRKILALIMALCLLIGHLPATAWAAEEETEATAPAETTEPTETTEATEAVASGTCGENLTWTLDETGLLTVSGTGEMTEAPWNIIEYSEGITSVKIEEGVTNIYDSAFWECINLTTISIPSSVVSIGFDAFSDCGMLRSVELPSGVEIIGAWAFCNCTNLTSISIPDTVTTIGENCFTGCSSLTEILVDSKNLSYKCCDQGVLYDINKAQVIKAPKSLSGVYTIDEGIASVGMYAFEGCTELETVILPSSVTEIKWNGFTNCENIKHIELPEGLIAIEGFAFAYCESLESIELPDSVESIGWCSFYGCSSLDSISFFGNAPTIGEDAFDEVVATIYYPTGNETWTEDVMLDYGGILTWVAYEPAAEVVASGTCGENLTWTLDVDGLLTISGTGDMYDYGSGNASTWDKDKILLAVIGEGVTSIGNKAFVDCYNMKSIALPKSIIRIGQFAFEACENLSSVALPDGIRTIEKGVFWCCQNLTSVVIPDSVIGSIGEETFFSCNSLTSVVIGNGVTGIEISSFTGCSSLETVMIGSGVSEIASPSFYGCSGLVGIWVDEDNVVYSSDSNGALLNKDQTKLIRVPGTIRNYTVPNTVTTIGASSFELNTNLAKVTIPSNVETIEDAAFSFCESLTDIILEGDAPTFASTWVFSGVVATVYYPAGNATYTDHYGNAVETRIDAVKVFNANLGYVSVPGLAVADYGQAVTCTVYDSEGNALEWATDSIEGYAHRMKGSLPGIVEAIVKFGVSSYNYFH